MECDNAYPAGNEMSKKKMEDGECHNLELQIVYFIFLVHMLKDLDCKSRNHLCPETGLSSLLWSVIMLIISWPHSVKNKNTLVRYEITQPVSELYFYMTLHTSSFFNATLFTINH